MSVWVTQPAVAVIFDHNVTALQLSCNGPLVTEQLWLWSNRGSDIAKRSDGNQREGKEKHERSGDRWKEIKAGRQEKKEERRKFYSNMQVDVKLIRMHLLKHSLNFWLEFQYHPLLMCFCFFFFLFCKNLRGGFFNQNDCTTALRCCLETWQLMCEIWDGKQVFDK